MLTRHIRGVLLLQRNTEIHSRTFLEFIKSKFPKIKIEMPSKMKEEVKEEIKSADIDLDTQKEKKKEVDWLETFDVTMDGTTKNEVTFRIQVLDTHPEDVDQNRLTVVCVQGLKDPKHTSLIPGSVFFDKGVRVIVPNYIGSEKLILNPQRGLPHVDYSTYGRLMRLESILHAKKIKRVDVLMSSSSGFWTLLRAGASWNNVHALVCLNPAASRPYRYVYPFEPVKKYLAKSLYLMIKYFIQPVVGFLYYRYIKDNDLKNRKKLKIKDLYFKLNAFCTEDQVANARKIQEKRLPMLVMFTENDDMTPIAKSRAITFDLLNFPKQNVVNVDPLGGSDVDPLFEPRTVWFTKCLIFATGGPEVQSSNREMVTKQVEDLLRRVRDSDWPDLEAPLPAHASAHDVLRGDRDGLESRARASRRIKKLEKLEESRDHDREKAPVKRKKSKGRGSKGS